MSIIDDLRVDMGDDDSSSSSSSSGNYIECPGGSQTVNSVAIWDGDCSLADTDVLVTNGNIVSSGGATFGDALSLYGAINLSYREITSAGDVVMNSTDTVLWINKTVGEPTTITLPTGVEVSRMVYIKDMKGDASVNFITVQMSGGTIDGLPNFTMTNNYQAITLAYNGSEWGIL